jgi:hypothetical protein
MAAGHDVKGVRSRVRSGVRSGPVGLDLGGRRDCGEREKRCERRPDDDGGAAQREDDERWVHAEKDSMGA